MPKITVDGKVIECRDRQMVLQACLDSDHPLPHYCYHPGLSIPASCRICLVEVEGIPKMVPSCQTPVRDGMVVHSKSPKAVANQKQVMEYLLINHPLDCPVCDQAGECYLQDYSYDFGRSESRFEEDKAKKPKKDVGDNIYLYADRCIMCTRCVRFTREVSGTSELFVEGRGYKEEIAIFPGKPCNNKLSGNVVDLCPVGALLDKDFLFKQRVWLLKQAISISPVDAGGENIYLEHNEGVVWRVKPRYNEQVNTWWISDDTRYSYRIIRDPKRIATARGKEHGTPKPMATDAAIQAAGDGLRALGHGSIYAVLSPMMSCEEAYMLGKAMRSIDPEAVLAIGPVPTTGHDEVFHNPENGKQTFCIKAEKVPNAAGIRRVLKLLGGNTCSIEQLDSYPNLKGGWIVGGYLSDWTSKLPEALNRGFRVVQDILPNKLTESADIVIPSAAWAEKEGCWENFAGKIQPFVAAVPPPETVIRDGDVYRRLLGLPGMHHAETCRQEMGDSFANIRIPEEEAENSSLHFVAI